MNEYEKLNDAVNEIFFSGKYAGSPIYLSLEDEERDQLATKIGVDPAELDSNIGDIVADTLDFSVANIYENHQKNLKFWRQQGMEAPPPFSALLLALTLAAEHMRKDGEYSANNYYRRLIEVLGFEGQDKHSRISSAGRYTGQFWHALNLWLTDFDYALGKPTAKQVNSWTYVSYAISQSLVRRGDRVRFHSLFAQFGLSPHDKLSESEMLLYLHEWMAGSGPSRWLARLWQSPDIHERIASACLDELEQWDGRYAGAESGAAAYRRLGWLASVVTFPRIRIRLHLVAGASIHDDTCFLQLAENATSLAHEALKDADDVRLENMPNTNLRVLVPEDKIKLSALLLTSIELKSGTDGDLYRHDSKPVVPMIKDETGHFYREVSRVTLHSPHLVLCHTNWSPRIADHLEKYAQPGFKFVEGDDANGLPVGWTLFRNVVVSAAPEDDVSDNLQCLVPIFSGAVVNMSGGLKLAQNIWHASSPPSVVASDEKGALETRLEVDEIANKAKTITATGPAEYDKDFINNAGHMLDGMNLTVAGYRGTKKVVERSLSFRSAKTPRRQASLESTYAYCLDSSSGPTRGFSARESDGIDESSPRVRGMLVEGEFEDISLIASRELAADLPRKLEEEVVEGGFNMTSVEGDEATCILRGYHHFICEPYLGPGHGEVSRTMQCRDCRSFQIAAKPRRGRRRRRGGRVRAVRAMKNTVMTSAESAKKISADSVYDAVCYLGSGTWTSLVPVLSSLVTEPWRVSVIRDELVDLGLIDVALDSDFGRAKYWSCPPPVLVITDSGKAYLSGFRNADLIRNVKESLEPLGAKHRLTSQESAPVTHTWELNGLTFEQVTSCLSSKTGPLGRPINVVPTPGLQIANQMPSFSGYLSNLNPIHVDDGDDVERFDPKTGKWSRTKLERAGAYRALFQGRRYFYRDEQGDSYETNVEVVKVLAAREEGVRLQTYNEATNTFECALGCKPPGLFRRALVSASGVQCLTADQKHSYQGVPKELAALVLQKLYG